MDAPTQGHETPTLTLVRRLLRFCLRVVRAFSVNGGWELVGALAYNGLLSVVPLFLLATAVFARFVDRDRFIRVVAREIRQLLPTAQAQPVNQAIVEMLREPFSGGLIGLGALLFFSTLAFRTLQHALDVIFHHRRELHGPRSLLKSSMIALGYVVAIGFASLLQAMALVGLDRIPWLAERVPRFAGWIGLVGTALALASIYWVMPVGRGSLRASLLGGAIAAVFWQALQGLLIWYFANISSVNLIYGSLAGIIVVLFSFELAAAIVLLAAQVIAELERSRRAGLDWYEAPPPSRPPGGSAR
ncbi:MAG TPA: YihY/virulence factor BrkB family protein [Polyangiales bacterium]|jgi:YihY family inner membrane protein|nr:YihY/virulence factor BrkB family protein [Polyangiales bacterium]